MYLSTVMSSPISAPSSYSTLSNALHSSRGPASAYLRTKRVRFIVRASWTWYDNICLLTFCRDQAERVSRWVYFILLWFIRLFFSFPFSRFSYYLSRDILPCRPSMQCQIRWGYGGANATEHRALRGLKSKMLVRFFFFFNATNWSRYLLKF